MHDSIYEGRKTSQISFPLGGLGTGCIGLAGNGRLIDWEIFNQPNKNSVNGFSHFAIKAEQGGRLLDARLLQSNLPPPYSGAGERSHGFGFGPKREHMTGLPHFKDVVFKGEFPLAELDFKLKAFPGRVRLTAFNPFIPLNDKDSGIPAAFFEFEIKNTTKKAISYSVAGTLANPLPPNHLHSIRQSGGSTLLQLKSEAYAPDDPTYGDVTLATDTTNVAWQEHWYGPVWFDNLEVYWKDFTARGRIKNRSTAPNADPVFGSSHGLLASYVRIQPGKTRRIRFVISWNFPTCRNYWTDNADALAKKAGVSPTWKNYYSTLWKDSRASAAYALKHWDRLREDTDLFKNSLFQSSLPRVAIDAVSANLSILKSPTVLRLEDGTFYGWEGCYEKGGCCEGSCTHVWNYAQALPFLFPALERGMREADYRYNQFRHGGMTFRLSLPLGVKLKEKRICVDGQFGGVLKAYRDWKICGDSAWLKSLWPSIKKSIEYSWSPKNKDAWDPDRTGVLWGRQHHTLDMELFGPNAWLTGFYLGALKAAAEMAEHLGETRTSTEYLELFNQGKTWMDQHLFNGSYYHQLIDLNDPQVLEPFREGQKTLTGQDILDSYWSKEHQEIKYQMAEGCATDQLLAQWHADLYGLGDIFDSKQALKALRAIYTNNFKRSMDDYFNPCLIYCLNDEQGLVICDWPKAKTKPVIPVPYTQQTMNGMEYAAAAQMIQYGMIEEGISVVKAVRDRYDGEKRNPWNEFECGSNYARSLASYSLLNAFSGFSFDMTQAMIGFSPKGRAGQRFRCFWSLDSGWGEFHQTAGSSEIRILYGQIQVKTLSLSLPPQKKVMSICLGDKSLAFTQNHGTIRLKRAVYIRKGQRLVLRMRSARSI